MTKSFGVAMLIVGTIIGAGFASGRELVSFFGAGASPFTAVLCAVLVFLISLVFLTIGRMLNAKNISEVNLQLAGKFHFFTDAFLLVNNLIVLAGMLAGMDTLGGSLFPLSPLYSVAAGGLCVVVMCKGLGGVMRVNKVTTPVMIAVLTATTLFAAFAATTNAAVQAPLKPLAAVVYICMNMMLASTVLTTIGKLDQKTIVTASMMAAAVMGILMAVMFAALARFDGANAPMPVLDMAKKIHPAAYWLMVAVLAISIFTTILTATAGLVSWFESFFGGKFFTAVLVLMAGFVLSNLGFANVVKFLYPVIGVSGVLYTALATAFVIRMRIKKHRRSPSTALPHLQNPRPQKAGLGAKNAR